MTINAYSIQEFSKRFGIGRSKVYQEIKKGHLVAHKAGRRTIIKEEDALNWISALPKLNTTATSKD